MHGPARGASSVVRLRGLALLAGVLLALTACKVTLLDAYDKQAEDGLLQAYGKVESLFDAIGDAQPADRAYARFAERYAAIVEMIRVQALRESARPLNAESFGIVSIIDTVFTSYRDAHKRDNTVADVLLTRHRDNLKRLFGAALRAERAKKDDGDD